MKISLWILIDIGGRILYTSKYETDCANYASIHNLTNNSKVIELKGEY